MNDSPTDPQAKTTPWAQGITTLLVAGSLVVLCWILINGVPTRTVTPPSVADEAIAFVREKKPDPLSGPLQTLLSDTTKPRVPSQTNALVGHPAPAFNLPDVDGQANSLESYLAHGPVVVVFYYGYSCNHCVSQLFDINEDLKYFRELGATVVAIGPDSPAHTKKKYAEYGAFGFPVLSDADRSVAARYGLFRPKQTDAKEWQAHGTFVLDRRGVVHWANTGDEPFTGNVTLLEQLAKLENRLDPKPASTPRSTQP